jgi:hypothetical protein
VKRGSPDGWNDVPEFATSNGDLLDGHDQASHQLTKGAPAAGTAVVAAH